MNLQDFIDMLKQGRPTEPLSFVDFEDMAVVFTQNTSLTGTLEQLMEKGYSEFQIGFFLRSVAKYFAKSTGTITVSFQSKYE